MEVNKQSTITKMLRIDDQEYDRVKEFKYLRTVLTKDNTTRNKATKIMANKTSCGLYSPNLNRQTECTLYETLIRAILTYGSECWSL